MSDSTTSPNAEDLYSTPAEALRAARATLQDPDAAPARRGEALWTLGRAAYYDNRMADAVRLLSDARDLIVDDDVRSEVLLTLVPAMAKEGRPAEALEVLDGAGVVGSATWAGQALNQRGIVLIELGRLAEARLDTERAVDLLRRDGDDARATRATVTLAVVASMLGDLDESERLYGDARALALATGQDVVAAGIEGNLGYVAARRGDFGAALDWYRRARDHFDEIGDVDMLIAVLEVDHARTLLDVGLASDAIVAADWAAQSASTGGNRMLELQSRLLCAEALVRMGDRRSAISEIQRSDTLARSLGHAASQRRVRYLASEIGLGQEYGGGSSEIDEILAFVDAGWGHEAYNWMLRRAMSLRSVDPAAAQALVADADRLTAALDVDPVTRETAGMLLADIDDDRSEVDAALDRALAALRDQQQLVGSAEVASTLAHRMRPMAEIAIDARLRDARPAEGVLDVLERVRWIPGRNPTTPFDGTPGAEGMMRLRDARMALAKAKDDGGDVAGATATVRALERSLLRERRAGGRSPRPTGTRRSERALLVPEAGTAFVTHVVHDGRLLGVRRDASGTDLVDLGEVAAIADLGLSQRAALRRVADRRRRRSADEVDRVRSISVDLDDRLIGPLELGDVERVVFSPAAQIRHLCWNALPSLEARRLTIAPTIDGWSSDVDEVVVRRLGFLGGPDLVAGGLELEEIGRLWERPDAVAPSATGDDAARLFERADLVHVAAHGAFRSDNPFFSALVFEDRDLSILEMLDLERVPSVVVLASCDAGASMTPTGIDDDVIVGTANFLRSLGASAVIAPVVAVNDGAAAEFSVGLHTQLVAGRSIDDAVHSVKTTMLASGDPVRMATAWAFNVMGGRSTQRPLRILR